VDFDALLTTALLAPVNGLWYFKKRVKLDGWHFTDCHFEGCTVVVAKGTFSLTRCKFSRCTLQFERPVWAVLQLQALFAGIGTTRGVLMDPDGRVTIT